jgi:seryl-tRNA synthetase
MDLEHEKRLTEVEARSKSNAHRLEEVEKKQDDLSELVGTVKVLATKEAQVEADVKEIKDDVKSLANKPGKRWELIVVEVIKLLVVATLGFILAKFGL